MRRRLEALGLMLAILVLGFGLIVAATEYEARADGSGQRLLTITDVSRALRDQGITLDRDNPPAHHPLLGITGTTLTFGSSSVEVYVYPTVAKRVADEQILQQQVMQLHTFLVGNEQSFRITSARNVLLLYHTTSADVAANLQQAARSLTLTDKS